jgi:cytochrome oxidase assembly protein ShyY1
VRLSLPALDEGPHKNYVLQWFAFAATAVVGGVALFFRSREA